MEIRTTSTKTKRIYIDTQTKILQSETLALQDDQIAGSRQISRIRWNARNTTAFAQPGGPLAQRPAILGAFLGRLSVRRVPSSQLIEVTFEAEDPQLAAQVVNAHLQNYIEQNFRSKYDATTQASTWLSSELEELRIKVEKSEDARIAYERQNQIWQIDEKQDINSKTRRFEQGRHRCADSADREGSALPHGGVGKCGCAARGAEQRRDRRIYSSENPISDEQYAEALNQYGPNFPKVAAARRAAKGSG